LYQWYNMHRCLCALDDLDGSKLNDSCPQTTIESSQVVLMFANDAASQAGGVLAAMMLSTSDFNRCTAMVHERASVICASARACVRE
jgi:hypothetical protein